MKTHLQESLQIFYLMMKLCENFEKKCKTEVTSWSPASWGFYVCGVFFGGGGVIFFG